MYIGVVTGNRLSVEGTLLSSRYTIENIVGRGGMAEVYLARDKVLDRTVALKLLKERYVDSEEFKKRFRREAESIASLSHPNIVSAYDWGKAEDGRPYIAMEYIEGGTLAKLITRKGTLDPFEATAVARQVALALAETHDCGVIHRDIKPHNIFLTGNPLGSVGAVKVGDFGIARAVEATAVTDTSLILGSVRYLSPEQARGGSMGPWSDLYSLGIVLYEMLTGRVPFDADGPIAVAMKHVSEVPLSPREVNPEVPEVLEAITLRLLSKNPQFRYPGALALAEDLGRVGCGLTPRYLKEEDRTEALEPPALPSPMVVGRAISPGLASLGDQGVSAVTVSSKRRRRRRRLSATAVAAISALTLAAGSPAVGLYEIPWLPEPRSLAEGMAANQSQENLVLPAQAEEGRYASQQELEKEKTPSETQGKADNSEEPAPDSNSSVSELASGESAPETQPLNEPTAGTLLSSTQPKAKSSRENGTSTSSTSPNRTGGTKGSSPPAKKSAQQSEPKKSSSEKTSGASVSVTKDAAANREEAQEEREEAREQAEEQAEEAAEEKEEAQEDVKERQKKQLKKQMKKRDKSN